MVTYSLEENQYLLHLSLFLQNYFSHILFDGAFGGGLFSALGTAG